MSYQNNPFVPQMLSPTAYEIGRFGKTPASHFYGLPNIAIPLTEVRAKGFSLPISLSYNAGGNKPDQHPGWVGLGWSLNAGGSIIRVINGMKDEMSVAEYSELHGMQLTDAPGYLYHADKVQTETDWMDDTALSQNSVPWIDNEPDEYILNIDGINASFFITGENTIAVVSKEEASIELESYEIGTDTSATALDLYPGKCPKPFRARRYSYIRSFVIRDKYGNRYFFGGDDNSIEYSVVQYPTLVARENGYTNTNAWKAIATANAWMLTRIERTDGEVVTFEYEKNGVPIVFSDIHNGGMFVSPEYPQLNFNYDTYQNMLHGWKDNLHFHFLLPSYLKSIKCLQSGDELEFTTEDTHELPYPITESDFCTYVGDFSGEYALTGPFSYSEFQAENRYRKLVSISGVKRNIVFEYADNLQTRLKLTGINLHDGIENGGRYLFSYNTLELPAYNSRMTDIWGYYNGIDYSGILGNFCDGMTEVRIPSENLMKAEILVAVTYPTGGRTEYSYEPHTYKKTALPFTFTPEECESETMAGGLRIKSITDYATDNIPQTRAFEYAENGVPSGILCTQIQCKASGNMTFAEEHVAYTGSYAIYSEMPLLPLSDTDGRHVTYSFVRERFPDGGYIDYRFTNFDTEGRQDGAPANEVGRGTACPLYPQFTSRSLFRGLVKEQTTYRSDGKVLIRELFTYGDEGASTNFKSVSRHSFAGGHVLFAAYVSAHCGYPALLTKSETRYLDNNSAVIEGYDYSYNSRRLATRACHSRQSDRIEEIFYYPDDRSGSPYEKMAEAGMHGVQVGKAYLRNNVVIKGSETIFSDQLVSYGPFGTKLMMLPQKQFSTSLVTPVTFSEYNSDPQSYQQSVPDIWIKSYDMSGNIHYVGFRDGIGAEYHRGQRTGQPLMRLQGKDVPLGSTIRSNSIRIGYLSSEFSTSFRTIEDNPFEATLFADYRYGFSVYVRIDDVTHCLTSWSIPEQPDEIWAERYGYPNSIRVDLPAGEHTIAIGLIDWRGNPASQDETGATLRYSYYAESEYQDMASFVDLDLDTEEGDGFHCEKGHAGPLTVSHPVVSGKTYVLDYMLKSDGTWQYIRTVYTGGDITIGGVGMTVSNVRIYPEDTMPESFAWRRFSGMSARIDAHGVTESYVYDDAGRLSEVRENNGNTLKSHSYAYGDGATVTTKEFTSEDGIENRTSLRSYDGLGRLALNTMKEGSPTGEDIIIRHEYDVMDRRIKTWLPAVSPETAYEIQSDDAFPYEEFVYESSPLDKLLSKYGPGEAWRDSDKAVHTAQMTNVSEQGNIRYHRGFNISWSGATLTLKINTSHTATGRFIIEKTIDEDDRIRLEFKNIYGETVLIRTILDNGSWIDTHFIYDAFGRLAAVLPPKLTAQLESSGKTTWTESEISALAFLYRYDNRGNCIARSLPDGGWTYFIYDKGNRLVFSQDAVQRADDQWTFRFEDLFKRECVTGVTELNMDVFADPLGDSNVYVTMPSCPVYSDTLKGYILTGCSIGSGVDILKVNYYDSYDFLGSEYFPESTSYETGYDSSMEDEYGNRYAVSERGLATGSLVRVLETSSYEDFIWRVSYYDDRGRAIQTGESIHGGGSVKEYFAYDFIGNITKHRTVMTPPYGSSTTLIETHTYDSMGRPLTTTHKVDECPARVVSNKEYDQIGRLVTDNRNGLSSLKETRTYNLRSWLTSIDGAHFKEWLYYHDCILPQWGGNISQMQWKQSSDVKKYLFGYDSLSRLVSATYSENSVVDMFTENYVYDQNGNMVILKRNSQIELINITGNKIKSHRGKTYLHDEKGRLISYYNSSAVTIQYNTLDLPQKFTFSEGGMEIELMYNADGRKLQEKVISGSSVTQRDYLGIFIYENGELKKILFEGGYVDFSNGSPIYMFCLMDHLGSVRTVVSETGAVVQTNDYYPYGDLFEEFADGPDGSANRFLFSGKEFSAETGLYDFSARFLHARFGRFTTIDPLAEKYPNISPYIYCNCNPVNFVDPDGMRIVTSLRNQSSLEQYSWQFHNDQWQFINTISSEPYKIGTNEYIDNLSHALTSLMRGASGASMIASLSEMPDDVTIGYFNKNTYFPSSDTVGWNYNNSSMIHTENGIERNIPYISLGHELGHAYSDIIGGGYNNGTWYIIEGKSILLDEIISTHLENLFRSENNLPLRQRYSNGGPLIIDKNRGSIYYNNDNQTYFRRVKKSERYIY